MEPHGAAQAHVQKGMKTAWNLLFDSRNLRSSVVRRSIVAGHNQPLSHCLKAELIWFLRLVVLACPVASAAFTRSREPKQMTLDSWTLWPSPSDWFQSLNSQATSKLHTHTHTMLWQRSCTHIWKVELCQCPAGWKVFSFLLKLNMESSLKVMKQDHCRCVRSLSTCLRPTPVWDGPP